jgi:hypothetical protein
MDSTAKQSVFVATFSTEERGGWFCPGLVNFLLNASALSITQGRQVGYKNIYNHRPIDSARNFAAREFLKTPAEWLLMLDNDIAPPLNLLDLADSADERMDIVTPLCVCNYGTELNFACNVNADLERSDPWFETNFAGTGVMFVRRRVFEKITPPWFRTTYSQEGIMAGHEDEFFCRRAAKGRFRIWVNPEFDCNHFRTVNLSTMFELVRTAAKKEKSTSA